MEQGSPKACAVCEKEAKFHCARCQVKLSRGTARGAASTTKRRRTPAALLSLPAVLERAEDHGKHVLCFACGFASCETVRRSGSKAIVHLVKRTRSIKDKQLLQKVLERSRSIRRQTIARVVLSARPGGRRPDRDRPCFTSSGPSRGCGCGHPHLQYPQGPGRGGPGLARGSRSPKLSAE